MKKKNLLTLLTATIGVAMLLTGCGKKDDIVENIIGSGTKVESNVFTGNNSESSETESTETTETESTETEVPMETEKPTVTAKPTETAKPTAKPNAPTEKPNEDIKHNDNKPGTDTKPVKPTPEPKPEVTPEPMPEITPDTPDVPDTPDPTPELTLEPTPEATPEPTPEPTPEVTPAPEIPDNVESGEGIGNGNVIGDSTGCSHDFVDLGEYLWAPTCNNAGSGNAQCKKCGLITGISIPATGEHTYAVTTEHGEASCGDYKTIGYTCSGCGDYYEDQIYDPNNHVEGGTCYDENGNCYGCGVHIHDVASESAAE